MSKSPEGEEEFLLHRCPRWDGLMILKRILTLDDKAKAKTAKGQVGKHGLFLWLADHVTFCGVVVELERQGELGGVDIFFDLKGKPSVIPSLQRCRKEEMKEEAERRGLLLFMRVSGLCHKFPFDVLTRCRGKDFLKERQF